MLRLLHRISGMFRGRRGGHTYHTGYHAGPRRTHRSGGLGMILRRILR